MENANHNKDQVFISFQGKDERNRLFLESLIEKLIDGNVNVFTDDKLAGQPLQNLHKHIRNSRIAIVIFSKSYAELVWCLDELVEIKKCIETEKLSAVIPIFHRVKVSSVKEQSGKFGEKFLALQNSLLAEEVSKTNIEHINSRIKRWKKALETVTQMSGLTYDKNSSEFDFVQKVVEKVNMNLANIAAEKGSKSTAETSKKSQGKQSNIYIFNINQLNLNNQLIYSKSLEALNPEGYSRSVHLKPLPRDYRRTVSDLDHRDQYGPFPFEAVMVQKQVENQLRIDNIFQRRYRGGTTCLSSMRYILELCLCLT